MNLTVESRQLQHCYCNELIKAGVSPQKAEQAAKAMTNQELLIIGEIWAQWASVLGQS